MADDPDVPSLLDLDPSILVSQPSHNTSYRNKSVGSSSAMDYNGGYGNSSGHGHSHDGGGGHGHSHGGGGSGHGHSHGGDAGGHGHSHGGGSGAGGLFGNLFGGANPAASGGFPRGMPNASQLQQMQQMVANMSPEQKQEMMKQVQSLTGGTIPPQVSQFLSGAGQSNQISELDQLTITEEENLEDLDRKFHSYLLCYIQLIFLFLHTQHYLFLLKKEI